MNKKLYAVLDAMIPAALVSTVAAACIVAADYLAVISLEQLMEVWAWLPQGWGAAHRLDLAVIAVVISVPPIGFIAWWMYRTARASQAANEETC